MFSLRYNLLRALWALWKDSYLRERGWFNSFCRRSAVDRLDRPVPWMNYPAVEFLSRRLRRDFTFFEFGSGNSTIYWSTLVDRVDCVEHDRHWHALIAGRLPAGARTACTGEDAAYETEILLRERAFDVVLVDGIRREECAAAALKALSPRGVLVLDDSFRSEYAAIFAMMKAAGFRVIEFSGPVPIQNHYGSSAIFYRDGNCLEI